MMLRLWLRWTWRDLRGRWPQVLATALVLSIGVGGFAGLRGLKEWREQSVSASLTAARAHDLRVDLVDGAFVPQGALSAALTPAPAGMAAAEERLVVNSQLEALSAGKPVFVPARLIGLPDRVGEQAVEAVTIKAPKGTASPTRSDAILDWNFADYYDLPSRGTVRIAGLGPTRYVGVGVSPQYFLIVDDAGVAGAQSRLAVVYLPLTSAQKAAGKERKVNGIVIRAVPGANLPALEREVRRTLEEALPNTGFTVTRGDEEPVTRSLLRDARSDQKLYTVFALLLLAGAALAAFNLVSRVVDAQRREIGIGMSLGAEPRMLAIRPLALGLQIGLLGVLLGVPVGIGLGELIRSLLRATLPLPEFASTFPTTQFVIAALLAIAIPLIAAAIPVRKAVGVQPVDAISVSHVSGGAVGATSLMHRIAPPGGPLTQLPLRNLARSPRRTVMTVVALGAVMTAIVAVLGMVDSLGNAADRQRAQILRGSPDRLNVALLEFEARDGAVVRRVAQTPGVGRSEPGLTVGAGVRSGAEDLAVALTFVDPDSPIWQPGMREGSVSGNGIALAEKAAEDLGVTIGDTVTLRHPKAAAGTIAQEETRVRVTGIHDNPIRAYAYMDQQQAGPLGLGGLATQVAVVPEAGTDATTITRELFGARGIASVQSVASEAEALQTSVEAYTGAIQMVVVLTLGLGLLVAFTSASVSVDERRREYATMFASGLLPRFGLRVAMVESLVTGLLGTLAGFGLGLLVTRWINARLLGETFPDLGVHTTLTATSILVIMVVGIGAFVLAPVLTFRGMRRMDIPSTLRVRE